MKAPSERRCLTNTMGVAHQTSNTGQRLSTNSAVGRDRRQALFSAPARWQIGRYVRKKDLLYQRLHARLNS